MAECVLSASLLGGPLEIISPPAHLGSYQLSGAAQAMERDDADGSLDSWAQFCSLSNELLGGDGDLSAGPRLAPVVADLCTRGLATLVRDYFLHSLEVHTIDTHPFPLSLSLTRTHTRLLLGCYSVFWWRFGRL